MATEKKVNTLPDAQNSTQPFVKLTAALAERFEVSSDELTKTIKTICFNGAASDTQLMMLLSFAKNYDLNPLARECYAFVSKDGRMSVGVQVDGWSKIANREENFNGQTVEYEHDVKGELVAITSKTYVKGREHPVVYRAVLKEWRRETEIWKNMPTHQLYVKARNEGIRFAFGIPAYDPDDIERIEQPKTIETTATVAADARIGQVTPKTQLGAEEAPDQAEVGLTPTPNTKVSATVAASPVADESQPQGGDAKREEPAADQTAASATQSAPSSPKAAPAEPPQGGEGPNSPSSPPGGKVREELDAFISKHVTNARLQILLAQQGASKVEDLTEEQAKAMLTKLQKRGK